MNEKIEIKDSGNFAIIEPEVHRSFRFTAFTALTQTPYLTPLTLKIQPDNFEHAKQLVNNIVKSLCGGVGRYSNRVSVVRFSADVSIIF